LIALGADQIGIIAIGVDGPRPVVLRLQLSQLGGLKGLTERTLQAWFLTLASAGWIGETRYGGETGVVCFKNPASSCKWCCVNKQNFVSIGTLAAFAQIAHDATVPVLAEKRVVGRLCP